MRLPRRPRLRAALACAIAALSLVCAAGATAAPLPGSLYDTGDGNQDNALGLDWQGAYAAGAVNESPDANDDCFVGGVKELAPDAWAFNTSAGGCTPGKSNLRVAYANPESSAATTFGHFAFFRNDTTGNTFLTFELNQTATSWTNSTGTTIPCRSNGDLLLSFEVGGSSLSTVLYRWVGDGSGPAACPNGAAGTFVGSGTIPASRFQGAMNSAAASVNYVNPAAYGALFPANAFGEAAVDLPAVLQSMGQSPCFGFLQMHVHSRSSSSISSAMIDYTKPVPVRLQSCSITGTEFQDSNGNGTRDAGEPGVAGFEVYADLDDDGARDAGEPTGTSGATGSYRILGVPAGSYKIRQVARNGWSCTAPNPCFYSRSLVTGGNSTGNDFGNVGPSTASGTAFEDLDADGTRDADEPALAGVVAYADLDGDAVADAGEPSGTSDSTGDWSISDIPAGTHAIRTAARSGWTCSAPSPCGWQRTFSSGSSSTGLQFGEFAAASIAGSVFEDVDGDGGAQTGGDAGLAGWQVYLDANANDTFDIGETQTVTTGGGAYAFSGLVPGAYVVRVTAAAANWYCTRPAVAAAACERTGTPTSGQSLTGQTFGVARTATVSGTKFNDIAGNGIKDGSDGALAGFEFWVDYDNDSALDAGEPSATSDAAGNWAITTVRAGSWTLREVPNGAYQCTKPSPCTYALTLASNGASSGNQFGNYVSRSVSGVVFDDADADGLARETGEAGLAGWFVYSDANSNSAFDAGEPSSTSNSLGQYNLTGLANGNYRIRLVARAGWTCSYPAGCLVTGSIGSGQSDTGMNFGVWGPSSISGSVYEDADADGAAREPGEAGLAGRVVYVDANANAAKDAGEASATTDGSGDYTLGGVNPGTYTLRLAATAGWTCSRPATCSFSVTTSAGSVSGRDFASYTTASISGHVYEDADADGTRDGGEPAIASRTVYLDMDGDGVKDAGEPSTATDASGDYAFSALAPAPYAVRQVLPAGWTQSAPASSQTITAGSGSATAATSLGSYAGATITGTIFEDADFDNSAQEAGDGVLAGRAVYLDEDGDGTQDDGEPVAATGPSGAFTFGGLKPGAYTVRATPPADWTCAYPAGCAHDVTVTSRATSTGNDFGTYLGASVTGSVFEDADADGAAREAGEAGVAGRRVYLDADADATRDPAEPTTLTTASGTYEFTGVVARGWTVRLDLDPGDAWSCDSPAGCAVDVTLSSGSAHAGADFGVHAPGSISGHLFTDRDDDGRPQVFGENDQPGRTVYADTNDDGSLDPGEPSATTDDRGDYTLAGLAPGSYRVRQVLPAGWSCSTPSPCSWTTTLASRETAGGKDFSSWTAAAFSGTFFEDSAGDGAFPEPGEPGLAGRTIYIDLDEDAQLDAAEPATATDGDGRYAFTTLAPGEYEVRAADQPAGWTCSYPETCAQELTLEAGEAAQDVSFGAWTTGTVAGVAYDDADASGSQDAAEPGIAGRTVWADLDHDGDQDAGEPAQVTDADGAYELTLAPGGYMLREKVPAGWTCTAPVLCGLTVTVTSRGATHDVDFGTRTGTGAVAGTIYEDFDGDLTRDAGDDGVGSALVYVDSDEDGSHDAGEPAQTTDSSGAYRFASLPAGDHSIAVERPAGWLCVTPGCARDVHVDAGDDLTGRDLALARAATISGTVTRAGDPLPGRDVYLDLDGDGTRDSGEPAAATGADGGYELTGLEPGEHSVRVELPANEVCSAPAGCVHVVGLTSGAAATGRDFAAYALTSLAGTVAEDGDGDGVIESGDEALAGVDVYLDTDGDGGRGASEPATTTAADGTYAFTGLEPDDYDVRLELPAGFACSAPAGCVHARTLGSGDVASGLDFALWRDGSIAGIVFNDRDGDGQRSAGEPPRAGIAVFLDLDDDGQADGGEPAASTGADGRYELTGIRPGAFALRVVPGADWTCTWQASCRLSTAVSSGHATAAADLGLRKSTAPVAGDETSTGVAGVPQSRTLDVPDGGSITLLDAGGQPTLTVVIAGQGTYVLDPATAVVTFTPEPGFTGAAHPVAYRISDADGAASDATYTPTVDPPAAALESAPAAPAPAAVPAAPAEQAAAAPAPPVQCVSRRTMTIHWKAPRRTSLRSIRISVNGKLYARLPGRARSAVIDMKGRPRQTVKVRITAIGRAGGTYGATRTYRPCRAHFAAPPLPTLRLARR